MTPAFESTVAAAQAAVAAEAKATAAQAALAAAEGDADTIQKAEAARRNATLVMQRASEMFSKGEITGAELTRLHAVRLRLDALVPLPGDLPPALDRSELRPIEGEGE